jgi:hypothetical protein
MSVVNDLQQITPLFRGERRDAPVVEDQHLHTGQALEHARIAAIAAGETEVFQQTRYPVVKHRPVVTAGTMPQGTTEPCFTRTGWSCDQQILMAFNPLTTGELLEHRTVEAAGRTIINILLRNQSAANDLPREDWLGLLIDREVTARDNKRLGRRLSVARLRQNAVVEDADLRTPRGLDRGLFQSLATCG